MAKKTIRSGSAYFTFNDSFFNDLAKSMIEQAIKPGMVDVMNDAIDEQLKGIDKNFPVKTGRAKRAFIKQEQVKGKDGSLYFAVLIDNDVPYVPYINIPGKKTKALAKFVRTPLKKKYKEIVNDLDSAIQKNINKKKGGM